jgi:hypothetical protein
LKLPTLSLLTSILSKLLQTSILLSFFLPSTKINHSSLPNEGFGNKYSQDLQLKIMSEIEPQNDSDSPFSRKGDGRKQRKIPTRWPMEGFITWWPLKGSIAWWAMEGSIVWWPLKGCIAWWAMEGEGATPFYLFSLSP